MVTASRTRNVKQVALRVVDLLEVRFVGDGLDALLKGDDLVVTCHHGDRAELQPFGQM